ncbi:prolyl oligopeptidase [Pseudoalteromonas sp. A25]|uniref:prolyl oligopeptidase family serine peptidase n=1 Tax=Pseudoalteromonas sp. A25 TaxID=116092 RepID=UPI0012606C6D|nr:prolyl oligopeptidase family serine peptidase [Pseudoalteromonas sp. A25]BBN82074.1 prolyl oligopeptidase [Pseudoalteromonas sp. A25]
MKTKIISIAALLSLSVISSGILASDKDPYMWLEDVEGEKALKWVKEQNDISLNYLKGQEVYQEVYQNNLAILNDKSRIPYVNERAGYYYNFWQDEHNVKGIYRRTTLEEYQKAQPKWETVLDLDALAKLENENWVYKDIQCHYPKYELCLISLSRGGADATVVREFNMKTKSFVKNGFYLHEAKTRVSWRDENSIFVATDFGENSLTNSGYPSIVKIWQREQPLETAKTVYTSDKSSVLAGAYVTYDNGSKYQLIYDLTSMHTMDLYLLQDGKKIKFDLPNDANIIGINNGKFFVQLKSTWQEFAQAEVIYADINDVGKKNISFTSFVKPSDTRSIEELSFTKSAILVTVLDDVKNKVYRYLPKANGQWQVDQVKFPETGSIAVLNTSPERDDFFVNYSDFLSPSSLYLVNGASLEFTKLKGNKSHFDANKYVAKQKFTTSKDGTQIPYFIVHKKDLKLNGKNPTLLYAYGGFELSMQPFYSAGIGKNWLAKGGVYVLANIRGGGEYGPRWHQAALKKNRHKAFEDFEAVAERLITDKVTEPKHLGIKGGSNGGLLVSAAFTRRPDLYNAVICQVPLLDMQRFNKLLAGASWMGEYGNPDNADEWQYIKTYSPYHNLSKDKQYPQVFFTTSTRDDRVHPGHARKMVAKMKDMGFDVLYFENMEGGHAGAANKEQYAMVNSLEYVYLMNRLH